MTDKTQEEILAELKEMKEKVLESNRQARGETIRSDKEEIKDGFRVKTETRADDEETEKHFRETFDLDDMNRKAKDYLNRIGEEGRKQMHENRIATLAVIANIDALKGNDCTKAFVGGVSVTIHGSDNDKMQILYQLVRAIYESLSEDKPKHLVDEIFDQFFDQLKNGEDGFNFSVEKAIMNRIAEAFKSKYHSDEDDED